MLMKIAWRNIWRNKVRSLVIIGAMVFGLGAGTFSIAVQNGMLEQKIRKTLATEVAHIEINHKNWEDSEESKNLFELTDKLDKTIHSTPNFENVSYRSIASGMAASASNSIGIRINGIDTLQEKKISDIHTKVIEGQFLKGSKSLPIVISKKMADKLKVKLKSKIVVTFPDVNNDLAGAAFRVTGIYNTGAAYFDEMNVFVNKSDLQTLLNVPENYIHEAAIKLITLDSLQSNAATLKSNLKEQKLLVRDWKELQPDVASFADYGWISMIIIVGIILIALAFGILNTMLMAILERVKEIGVLMAVGMGKFKIFLMILLETIMLSMVGSIIGLIISFFIIMYFGTYGMDMGGMSSGLEQFGYDRLIYTKLEIDKYMFIALMAFITAIISALYPAFRALKLSPTVALRSK